MISAGGISESRSVLQDIDKILINSVNFRKKSQTFLIAFGPKRIMFLKLA
jgi:uncharacterized protein (UPF0276 family)